jgi:hypothetical protein
MNNFRLDLIAKAFAKLDKYVKIEIAFRLREYSCIFIGIMMGK